MNNNKQLLYITSPICTLNLYHKITFNKLKISSVRYKTATNDNKYMLIVLNKYSNHIFYNDTKLIKYFKCVYLPDTSGSLFVTENNGDQDYDYYNNELEPQQTTTIDIIIYINGEIATDISNLNCVIMEIDYDI
jgi:hypothetical protein